jgi:hypothetical protein
MAAATVGAAISGLKLAKDSLGALMDAKVAIDANGKILDVLKNLGDAEDALFNLPAELIDLQQQNADSATDSRTEEIGGPNCGL